MKVLLHICCAPCACACVPRLKELGHEVALFFSNSNIDTPVEFEKRSGAARKLAEEDGVEIVFDEYNHTQWLADVAKGFESEPEKGARCERCFRFSMLRAAKYAAENGYDAFTTSLTVSPHKPTGLLFAAGDDVSVGRAMFLREDFKKREGFKKSTVRSRELGLYRQNYCGCEFSRRVGG